MKRYVFIILAILALSLLISCCFAYAGTEWEKSELAIATAQVGETEHAMRIKDQLEMLLSPLNVSVGKLASLDQFDTYQELRIRWNAYVGAPDFIRPDINHYPVGREFIVFGQIKGKGKLPRLRSIELSSDQLFVAAINAKHQLKAWALIPDPRILRAESPDVTRQWRGKVLHASKPEFTVAFPDDPEITELQFYHPNWTGKVTFELLGIIRLK